MIKKTGKTNNPVEIPAEVKAIIADIGKPVELNAAGRRHAAKITSTDHKGVPLTIKLVTKKAKATAPTFTCLECGKVTEHSPFVKTQLYCRECSGHKHTATIPEGTKKCKTCRKEFTPSGRDAWQVQRCPECRAKQLERVHARLAEKTVAKE
jgi:DNA-directed RNA polymerase subunit RPC12/RpoP